MKVIINIVALALAGMSSSVYALELRGGAIVSSESEPLILHVIDETKHSPSVLSPSDALVKVLAGTSNSALPQVSSTAGVDEEEFNNGGCATTRAYRSWKLQYCGWTESRKDRYDEQCAGWRRNRRNMPKYYDNCCDRPLPRCAGIYGYYEKDFLDKDFQDEDFQDEDFEDFFLGEDVQDEDFQDEDFQDFFLGEDFQDEDFQEDFEELQVE